ncbi:hypothetical protein SMICM304S_01316 [Streptomyces microflavus]
MMYRCGWGTKEGQEVVLAVEIDRSGLEWALAHAELSHGLRRAARAVRGVSGAPPGSRAPGGAQEIHRARCAPNVRNGLRKG